MFRIFLICCALMGAIVLAVAVASADDLAATGAGKQKQTAAAAKPAQTGKPAQTSKDKDAQDDTPPSGDVKMSGMSVLGNEDAPKSLVIVPWKSAEIGKMPGLSMLLDDALRPVDKDVFMRELAYYQVRAGSK